MPIVWRDAMSIDDGPIDDEHKFWISLANGIDEALQGGVDSEKILENLKKLKYYTVYHFMREEAIQREIGYPDHEQHAEKHRQLVAVVDNALKLFEQEIHQGKHQGIRDNMVRLLKTWIVGHIVNNDIPMRSYIRMHRRGPYRGPISTV